MRKFYSYFHLPILILFGISALFYFNFTAEDAFITYRYAENLVNTGSLVYNEGEPINAMTSPLHAVLSAALFFVTGDTVLSYKILSLILVMLSVLTRLESIQRTHSLAVISPDFVGTTVRYVVDIWRTGNSNPSFSGDRCGDRSRPIDPVQLWPALHDIFFGWGGISYPLQFNPVFPSSYPLCGIESTID